MTSLPVLFSCFFSSFSMSMCVIAVKYIDHCHITNSDGFASYRLFWVKFYLLWSLNIHQYM